MNKFQYVIDEENQYNLIDLEDDSKQCTEYGDCEICGIKLEYKPCIYEAIETNIKTCNKCQTLILNLRYTRNYLYLREQYSNQNTKRNHIVLTHQQYSGQITITFPHGVKMYNIKKGYCEVCYMENKLLVKLNLCDHYCCNQCLIKYIKVYQYSTNMLCPFDGCRQVINDYLIVQFLDFDFQFQNFFIYTQFCFTKKCQANFTLEPYSNIKQNNIYYVKDEAYCLTCKNRFCKFCWTQHFGKLCDFEKLFQQFAKKQDILICPKCKSFSDSCPKFKFPKRTVECKVCQTLFCWNCKNAIPLFQQSGCENCLAQQPSCQNQFRIWYKIRAYFRIVFNNQLNLSISIKNKLQSKNRALAIVLYPQVFILTFILFQLLFFIFLIPVLIYRNLDQVDEFMDIFAIE